MSKYWDTEEIFLDGDQYFDHLLRDIDLAQELITVEIYIFNDDSLGNKIATHLIQAHQRGVKVQIVVDGVGSYGFFDKLYPLFLSAGIKVKMFHPLPLYHPVYENLSFKRRVQTFFTRLWRLNQRNHRKIIIIDGRIMFAGSFNFSVEHTDDHHEIKWKDMGVRVEGQNVMIGLLHFKKIWGLRDYFRYRKKIKPLITENLKYCPLRLNHSLFMKRFYYRDLMNKINQSQVRIWLMTPYFIPKRNLIRKLGKAAQRGIDVRILISSKSDVSLFRSLQFFYYAYLIKKGVKVFQYAETVLHAKAFIIDDWMTIGTSNLNHRSILHDLEVDVSIQDPENKKILERDFLNSAPKEIEITIDDLKQRTLFDRFLSRLFFVFKYWF